VILLKFPIVVGKKKDQTNYKFKLEAKKIFVVLDLMIHTIVVLLLLLKVIKDKAKKKK